MQGTSGGFKTVLGLRRGSVAEGFFAPFTLRHARRVGPGGDRVGASGDALRRRRP